MTEEQPTSPPPAPGGHSPRSARHPEHSELGVAACRAGRYQDRQQGRTAEAAAVEAKGR